MILSTLRRNPALVVRNVPTFQRHIHGRGYSTRIGSVLMLSNLYPQPSASAAGVRTSFILKQLCRDDSWTSVHYGTGAKEFRPEDVSELRNEGVVFHSVPPNRSHLFKELLGKIPDLSVVILDRFYAEEAYSFHIHNQRPNVVRVVDMQDMHSLRQGRQALVEKWTDPSDLEGCLTEVMGYQPSHNDSRLLRELSSLHRSDLVLVCSPREKGLLEAVYQLPPSKLQLASFWVKPRKRNEASFDERRDFCVLGGFRHAPNVDAVQQLAQHIWPKVRAEIPGARVHIYGAYTPPKIKRLHDSAIGFEVHGFAPDLGEVLSRKRVLLAPLRFGAGIKGKIIDAWNHGVPVVTTPIGSEGMRGCHNSGEWGGIVASSVGDFVSASKKLYISESQWHAAKEAGKSQLLENFSQDHWMSVAEAIRESVLRRDDRRSADFTSAMLWHQTARSTEYFSRWIESKESGNDTAEEQE